MLTPRLVTLTFVGVPMLLVVLIAYFAVRSGNKSLLKAGLTSEAEILSCTHFTPGLRVLTEITFSFVQKGHTTPVKVTKILNGHFDIPVGSKMPIKYMRGHPDICLLVPYERFHGSI